MPSVGGFPEMAIYCRYLRGDAIHDQAKETVKRLLFLALPLKVGGDMQLPRATAFDT